MRQLQILVSRNVALFMKNKTNVLLSVFSIGIVIGLYVLFLRDFMLQSVEHAGLGLHYVNEFTDRMMVSGLFTVINTTTCFGMMQLSVADAAAGIQRDILVAPVSRFQLAAGYWISGVLVSFFFCALTLCGTEMFFTVHYGDRQGFQMVVKGLGILLFSSCVNSGLLIVMIRFMKDTASFSTFGNLYGLLCGFLAGTYLPYSMYPDKLRKCLFYFPPMQLTSIFRQNHLSVFRVNRDLIGKELYQAYGVRLMKAGNVVLQSEQWSLLLVAMAVILLLMRIEYRDNYEWS